MDKGLFFLILAIAGVWLILDDFFGRRYISNFSEKIAPKPLETVKQKATDFIEQKKQQFNEARKQEQKSYFGELKQKLLEQNRPA